jgi:HD-like signal output (HDOD) protein
VTDILTPEKTPVRGLLAGIYREIMTDKAHLPSMPDVALRIRASMQQPNYTAATVARVIKADPGVSAYLLRAANSALYRGVAKIQNVENAVARLGMDAARNLVTAYALKAMFKTRSRVLSRLMRETWRQSARRAALASVIATRCPGFDPDRAMLGGLLQDIGVLPLLHALEGRKDLPDPERIRDTVDMFAGKVGVMLLTHWEFDEALVEVARSRSDWWRNNQPEADLADVVMAAHLHASVGTVAMREMPLINETPAFLKLPLGEVGPDASLAFLREAEADVLEVMQMLGV